MLMSKVSEVPLRRIGGLEVSALGLGCMGMSLAYGRGDRRGGLDTIREAIDLGVRLLDTADMYGGGANEQLVGEAVRGRRAKVVLATKFGITAVPGLGLPRGVDARPERARRCLDASLRRLDTDHLSSRPAGADRGDHRRDGAGSR